MIPAFIGALLLAAMTVVLFALSFVEVLTLHGLHVLTLVSTMTVASVGVGKWNELWTWVAGGRKAVTWDLHDVAVFSGVVGGAVITYALSISLGLGPVVAAGFVGIMATLTLRRYDVPIYCGAFVGMACSSLLHGYEHLLLASGVAGAVFLLAKPVFNGFGGKLGTIAFIGCISAALLTGRPFGSAPVPGWDVGVYLLAYSVLGAVLTYVLNVRFGHSPVLSSGLIGLAGGLILPVVYPAIGGTLAIMVICASFAGMSSRARVPNELYVAVAGVLCALVFMYSSPHLGGAGGKLGTIAFGSVIATAGLYRLTTRPWRRLRRPLTLKSVLLSQGRKS